MRHIIKNLKEKQTLARVKTIKDPEAFGELYDQYADKIYRFILFKVSSVEDAKDITAETFLKVWQYITSGENAVKNFQPLLYTVARNLIIDHYREKSKKAVPLSEQTVSHLAERASLIEQIETNSETEEVFQCLQELKDEYREVILLKYVNELSVKEIAKVLEKKRGTVRVLLYRALHALERVIEEKRKQQIQPIQDVQT